MVTKRNTNTNFKPYFSMRLTKSRGHRDAVMSRIGSIILPPNPKKKRVVNREEMT